MEKTKGRTRALSLALALLMVVGMFSTASAEPEAETMALESEELTSAVAEVVEPSDTYRAGFRYMLPAGDVADDPEMRAEMEMEIQDFYDKGYRYIEVSMTPHSVSNDNGVDSDKWRETLKAIYTQCNELGMEVQIHMGYINSGEPFIFVDNETVEGESSFRQKELLSTDTLEFSGGSTLTNGRSLSGTAYNNANTPQAVLAIRYEMEDGEKKQLEVIQLDLNDFTEDVSSGTYTLTYNGAPLTIGRSGETWEITGYYQAISPSNYTGGFKASNTAYCLVDYFSVESAEAHIDTYMNRVFDDELVELIMENGGGFMYDGADGHPVTNSGTWSDGLPDRFNELTGYDLLDYLGVIYSGYTLDDDEEERLAYDKLNALSDLYCDYLERMTEWANSLNNTYIHQAGYSTLIDTMKVMMAVEQPEVESLDFGDNVAGYISVTGAAHMAGSNIVSDELGAMLNTAYGADVTPLLQSINIALVSGVNQMLIHTTSHRSADDNTPWPGHALSYNMIPDFNSSQPSWDIFDYVAEYTGRAQYAMQQGTAQRDVAIYMHTYALRESRFKNYEDLMTYGYTFDLFSPDMLAMDAAQNIQDGVFDPDGGAYKAFVVDEETLLDGNRMPVESAEVILSYAQAGIPVIVVGSIPTATESIADSATDLAEIWAAIQATGNLHTVSSDADIAPKLIELGVTANAVNHEPSGIANYMRSTEAIDYYFLYNRGDSYTITYPDKADANHAISFKGEGQPYQVNLWTGEVTKIADYVAEDGYITVNMELEVDETTLVFIDKTGRGLTHATDVADNAIFYYDELGNLMMRASAEGEYNVNLSNGETETILVDGLASEEALLSDWTLEVESWTPTYPFYTTGKNAILTTKTMLDPIELDSLDSWLEIADLSDETSGIGYYSTTFTLDGEFDGAILDLGDVYDVAKVYINGQEVIMDQLALTADLGEYLEEENELLIVVPTGLINTLIALDTDGQYFSRYTLADYGLFGDVVVTPYVDELVAESDLATIYGSAYQGGTVDEITQVYPGDDAEITVRADEGSKLVAVLVDGVTQDISGMENDIFTIESVQTDMTLRALFVEDRDEDFAAKYTDVDGDDWFYGAVDMLTGLTIVEGVDGESFAPNKLITRAEFTKLMYALAGVLGVDVEQVDAVAFGDVEAAHWAYGYIGWAYEAELVTGYDEETFGPEDDMLRQDMAVFMQRFFDEQQGYDLPGSRTLTFVDEGDISGYAEEAVDYVVRTGLMQGHDTNEFGPRETARRSHVAQVIENYLIYSN